jgi:wobble nucleotide-excising tRNase
MKKVKVKDELNLVRDLETKAVINTDMQAYDNYINSKKVRENDMQKIKNLENDVNEIKNDLTEIKNLLRNLINGP